MGAFERYRESALHYRRFQHRDIIPLIRALQAKSLFEVTPAGRSVEGREIYLIKAGTGSRKVLLWSQMHGDEATATMALFDIFHFLAQRDEFDGVRNQILRRTTLYFLPMLNPDGAEVFQRRNALGIDLNRDALHLQSPEARLLKDLLVRLQPEFGFNLHDQNPLYSVGKTGLPAALSFLAPPYDAEKSVNEVRARAMRLIVHLNRRLQPFIPGLIGRFADDFEPRAFGDNIQKWGTSVLLLESGGYRGDPEKQVIRQLNFVAILSGLKAISSAAYEQEDLRHYAQIPPNGPLLYHHIIRNVTSGRNGEQYHLDLGIIRTEISLPGQKEVYVQSTIAEVGDLSVFKAYDELDASGMTVLPGRVYPASFESLEEVAGLDYEGLLQQGFLYVHVKNLVVGPDFSTLPLNILMGEVQLDRTPAFGQNASFLLQEGERLRYAVVNGFVYDLRQKMNGLGNGLIFR